MQEIKKTGCKMEKFLGDLNCEQSVIYTHQDFVSLKDNRCRTLNFYLSFYEAVSFFPRSRSCDFLTYSNLIMFSALKKICPNNYFEFRRNLLVVSGICKQSKILAVF